MSGSLIKFGVWKEESDNAFVLEKDDLASLVTISRRQTKDTFNRVTVRWTDVSKESGYSYVTVNDAVDQRITGYVRKRTYNLTGLVSGEVAIKMAYRLLAESMYRAKVYKVTLAYRSMVIEVGDVGVLSDGHGLYREKIRITRVSEDQNGKRLEIEATEEKAYLYLSPDQNYSTILHDRFEYPDLVSPNVYFTEDRYNPTVNLHICPQDEYFNGFAIYYSLDGTTYQLAGTCSATLTDCNIDGTSVGTLSTHPAVIHKSREEIELSQNVDFAAIQSVSDSQFFNNQSLIKLDDEVLAFKTSEASGANYIASNLIRALFNTEAPAHSPGETWHTLNIDFKFNYLIANVGQTVYFKVLTIYGPNVQQLSDVSPVTHQIVGEYQKPAPVSITRISGREGWTKYGTDDFDTIINLASKTQGWNIGGFDVLPWGAYVRDMDITLIETRVEETDETLIHLETEAIDLTTIETFTKTITAAMRDGNDPVLVKITPGGFQYADRRSIQADDYRS